MKTPAPLHCHAGLNHWLLKAGVALAAGLLAGGCTTLHSLMPGILPTTTTNSQIKWQEYAAAKAAYDSVTVGATTHTELQKIGFNTDDSPNTRVLNYVDVVNLFGSGFRPESLPDGVKQCEAAQDQCFAYVLDVQNLFNKREGSIPADLLGFRKYTRTTGWKFVATLVLVNDVVVYKLWNGTPKVETYQREVTPLGPMQNLGFLIPKPGLF